VMSSNICVPSCSTDACSKIHSFNTIHAPHNLFSQDPSQSFANPI
jgi:hypothetical protein